MQVAKLGCDPLRSDADPNALWHRVKASQKSIGGLLMDQGYFAGVGNIYRAEILFCAGVHPEIKGSAISRAEFDRVWAHSVSLMTRGFTSGSILTVDPAEAAQLGKPSMRRYIYNSARCGRCNGPVRSWDLNGRTCYVCASCQPLRGRAEEPAAQAPRLFHSHCAPEGLAERLASPSKLKVAELRETLAALGLATDGRKGELLVRLQTHMAHSRAAAAVEDVHEGSIKAAGPCIAHPRGVMRSAQAAAKDKESVGESRAVEHVADDESRLRSGAEEWLQLGVDGKGAASARTGSTVKDEMNTTMPMELPVPAPASDEALPLASPQKRERQAKGVDTDVEPSTKRLRRRASRKAT